MSRYEPSVYIETLMALTALTISMSLFGFLRTLTFNKYGPNLLSYLFILCVLILNLKFGYTLWKREVKRMKCSECSHRKENYCTLRKWVIKDDDIVEIMGCDVDGELPEDE